MASMNAFLKWLLAPETALEWDRMHRCVDAFIAKANRTFAERNYPIQLANWFSVWSIMYTQPGRYHWMLQYYLKDAGVNLSWVGTGRLLFSLDWEEKDFAELRRCMLDACAAMMAAGWWEVPKANIKVLLAKENLTAIARGLFGSKPSQAAVAGKAPHRKPAASMDR